MPRLTLLRAKEALQHKAPTDRLEFRINRVHERYLANKEYSGATDRLAIAAPYGQLTLPRRYIALEGAKVNGFVFELANQWYEMLPGRHGVGFTLDAVRDLGDGHAIIYDLPTAGNLQLSYTGAIDWPVTIYGTDSNALPVTLTIPNQAPVLNPFATIDRVHKEFTGVSIRLYHFTDDLVETNLALMAPKEEETYYHRYSIDNLAGTASTIVEILAKLRHIEFTDDQDTLHISNISALEAGMDALQYEAENDVTLATQYWKTGVDILNGELLDIIGAASFPVIRLIYPGRTAPRFQSRY